MIVTIDGPAGAGKSSVARKLADRLGFRFLDTGAMYRAVAWALTKQSVDLDDHASVSGSLNDMECDIRDGHVRINGQDVTRFLRDNDVTRNASIVAAIPEVREVLVQWQRGIASRGNYVCEGRDQGTVAFPDSRCKFFLTASPEVRARRRWLELKVNQPELTLEDVIAEQKIRDLRDETRATGRLVKAVDAVELRVDQLELDEVVDELEKLVRDTLSETAQK